MVYCKDCHFWDGWSSKCEKTLEIFKESKIVGKLAWVKSFDISHDYEIVNRNNDCKYFLKYKWTRFSKPSSDISIEEYDKIKEMIDNK